MSQTADVTYSDAVAQGFYDLYEGGLSGKHDNVRTYWEERIRGQHLRPYLQNLVRRTQRAGRKVRIADLGAGSGEALRLITSLNVDDADLNVSQAKVLPMEDIEFYVGSDLCEAMVRQGRINFATDGQVHFEQGDFSEGFPLASYDPFDLYCCSFASYSHIDTQELTRLFTEMFRHADDHAILVGEWLGRHSIEWPCYWDVDDDRLLDYSMSWLPGAVGGIDAQPERFPMRYWLGEELRELLHRLADQAGRKLRRIEFYDCSVFIGRHVDTGQYNDWVRPLRRAVNSLHEPNLRTDLTRLRAELVPVDGYDELNGYFAGLQFQWNSLIDYCSERLERRIHPASLANWRRYPTSLQMAMITIDRVIDAAYWLQMGDPRANVIEPQIGYALRNLEMEYQTGQGRGHSLVAIMEIGR